MKDTFSKIAVFQYSSEAQIFKGRLEAEGIQVYLRDQFTVDTDPLVSNAIGGVKIMVAQQDTNRAFQVLNDLNQYSLDDEGHSIECPNCGSEKIQYFTNIRSVRSFLAFCFSFFAWVLPIHNHYEYHCENCKEKFSLK